MADPVTISLILLGAGTGLQAFAAIKQGQIAEAQGKFEKKLSIRNQQSLERQAKAEEAASRIEETRLARKEKIVKAQQRAVIGKTGIGLAGSTTSVLTDTAVQFFIARNLTLRGGLIRSRELRERGRIEVAKGRWAKTLGIEAKKISYISAGGSVLAGIGTAGLLAGTGGGLTPAGRENIVGSFSPTGQIIRPFGTGAGAPAGAVVI